MADELVLVGIHPKTRQCELISVDDDGAWKDCRELGLIPFKVQVGVARKLFGARVPCLDALLPVEFPERACFVHVVAPELGDNVFAFVSAQALRAMADLIDQTGATEACRTGLWLNDGPYRLHVADHWPLED